MAIEVKIPTILRTYTDGEKVVTGSGQSLAGLIDDLETSHPGIKAATCAASSTSTSTTRTCGSSAASEPRSPTATRSSSCPP